MGLLSSVIENIKGLPYVTTASARYMTAGVSQAIYRSYNTNADQTRNEFDYTARFVMEATFINVEDDTFRRQTDFMHTVLKILTVSDVKLLAGNPEWFKQIDAQAVEGQLRINSYIPMPDFYEAYKEFGGVIDGVIPRFAIVFRNNHISEEQLNSLIPGQRYIIVGRVEPYTYKAITKTYIPYSFIGDDTLYNWWPYIYPLEGQPKDYLKLDEFAQLRELIQVTNDDMHTLDVVYTDDMQTIRRIDEEKMLLTQGRLLTPEDTANGNKVCVVSDVFMKENILKLGDTIKLKLGDKLFEQYAPLGSVASVKGRYANAFTEAEFEIVGVYVDINWGKMREVDYYWAYSDYTVFVPLSFLPESVDTENHNFKPAEISFVIGDARNMKAFIEECIPQIEAIGLTVYFNDGGWLKLEKQFNQVGSLVLLKLLAFVLASVLAGALTVYLFIMRKRREYAIMRALGTTKKKAARTLFIPLMLIAVIAVTIGSLASIAYASQTASKAMDTFVMMGLEVDTTIPVYIVITGMLGILVVEALLAITGLYITGRTPPLMLLQDNTNRKDKTRIIKKAENETQDMIHKYEQVAVVNINEIKPLKRGCYSAVRQVIKYALRRNKRAMVKSLMALMLAVLLSGAMGQFTVVRQSYTDLYNTIVIKAFFIKGLSYSNALKIADSGYVHTPYYEFLFAGEANLERADIIMSNNIKRLTEEPLEFLDGYDEATVMDINEKICIMPKNLMETLGLKLGDTVELNQKNYKNTIIMNNPYYTEEEIMEAYHKHSVYCKIVGCFMSDSVGQTVAVPIAAESHFRSLTYPFVLDLAEYILSDYHRADEFRQYSEDIVYSVRNNPPLFIMDTTEADNIYKIYKLIETLYPIAAVIAILIGAVLPGLIIIQSAKEASVLRVLGTTKRRTRVMLIIGQLMLCLIGLLLAFAVLAVVNRADILKVIEPLSTYCLLHLIGCTVGTTIAAVTVTRRKILELLQVKE